MSHPHAWTKYKDIRPCIWSVGFGTASAIPATSELRYHQKIHHCKADQAGHKPLLHDTTHQSPWIQHADHQLSEPEDRHLDGKRREGKTPFRCTETKHSQPSTEKTQSADLPLKAMSSMAAQLHAAAVLPTDEGTTSGRKPQHRKLAPWPSSLSTEQADR